MSTFLQKLKPSIRPLPPGLNRTDLITLLATGLGSGRLRPGSGTWGSIAALPLGYLIASYFGMIALGIAALALLAAGTWAAHHYGLKSGQKDDQAIVIDEVVGMWIAAIPAETDIRLWFYAFLLFRFFDIVKPWPASYFDNRAGHGFDVMMDDVVAGICALMGVATIALLKMPLGV